jgi:DNA-binding beta-propeller fold protein YncE
VADIGNHRIRRLDLADGIIETIAGNGERQLPQDGTIATGRPMLGPRALFIEGDTLWIALREGHSVWRLELDTMRLKHVAGSGQKGCAGDGGPAKEATFNGPKGIAVGPHGKVYVVDTENHVIRVVDPRRDTVDTVAGSGERGYAGDGGPARAAAMDRPHGICVDQQGTLYIGDTLTHRVRRVRP